MYNGLCTMAHRGILRCILYLIRWSNYCGSTVHLICLWRYVMNLKLVLLLESTMACGGLIMGLRVLVAGNCTCVNNSK